METSPPPPYTSPVEETPADARVAAVVVGLLAAHVKADIVVAAVVTGVVNAVAVAFVVVD